MQNFQIADQFIWRPLWSFVEDVMQVPLLGENELYNLWTDRGLLKDLSEDMYFWHTEQIKPDNRWRYLKEKKKMVNSSLNIIYQEERWLI